MYRYISKTFKGEGYPAIENIALYCQRMEPVLRFLLKNTLHNGGVLAAQKANKFYTIWILWANNNTTNVAPSKSFNNLQIKKTNSKIPFVNGWAY